MDEITKKIMNGIDEYYQSSEKKFIPGVTRIQFGGSVFDAAEVKGVVASLLDGWLARGKLTDQFERGLAELVGSKETALVNSGSSALMLAWGALKSPKVPYHLKDGDEIITSALTHVATVNSILHNNLKPVLIDADWTYDINPDLIEGAITKKTRGILPMHFLGNPCKMDKIMDIAKKNNLFVVEDSCDAFPAKYDGKKVGTFGDMGSASFYVAHLLTLAEGGAVFYDNPLYGTLVKSLRDWGRSCPCTICKMHEDPTYKCPSRFENIGKGELENYDSRYMFTNVGYNLRTTEMQAAFGLEQLKKVPEFIKIRERNFNFYKKELEKSGFIKFPEVYKKAEPIWFAVPLTITESAPFKRKELVEFLESKRIETRPFFAGLITQQPAYKNVELKVHGDLPVTKYTKDNSFFLGCYQGITEEMASYVVDSFNEFFKKY
ncbi:UDP-4-amino-4-deoxy-L-arabinose--oxoglutarate aminotransferase [uncultured archaeon]|nr:UDP-4-amino-4-deoxy-L-arabinose--oxoglutarate aminotransferase [uncultured archaeon]